MKFSMTSTLLRISRWALGAALIAWLAACGGGESVISLANPPTPLPTCSASVSANAPLTAITSVQGSSNTSPLVSQTVTVRGVVVGSFQNSVTPTTPSITRLNGFFIQQPVADTDPLTSEGLFVFAPGAATFNLGDYVQVQGTVTEFGGTATSVTQLAGSVTVSLCGSGVVVLPTQVSLPLASGTELERYEGMLVQFSQTLAVTELFELGRYGRVALSLAGRQFHPNNGNLVVTNAKNLLERITLDDNTVAQNPNPIPYLSTIGASGTRRVGDTVQNLVGVLNYTLGASGVGSYSIHPVVPPSFTPANSRPVAAPVVAGNLKVASFNVLNYFTTLGSRGANTSLEFDRQKAKIVEAILGLDADVLGLMEIENNNDVATQDLVAALNARLGAGTYAAVNSGRFGSDVIKVDILYKPAKVKRVGGVVLPTGADLANYTAVSGRPPLAQRFASLANGGGFWFVVNHFKSKGSCPTTGDVELGQGCWNVGRTGQATALNSFVDKLKLQGETDVLMMGDFNSYLNEDPTVVLESAGFESLLKRMPANDRFTYVFNGETGALDHGYASTTMRSQVTSVGVWHINADEPPVIDYNTEFKPDDRYAATPYRASDHDPVILGVTLTADSAVNLPILNAIIPPAGQASVVYGLTVTDAMASSAGRTSTVSVNWGDATPVSVLLASATTPVAVTHSFATSGSFTVTITLTDSNAQTVSVSGVVSVAAAPPAPAAMPDLFFSEYVEGSSNNKALEIYNPTTQTVNLSNYVVKLYSYSSTLPVGQGAPTTPSTVLTLTGVLSPGGVLVIVNSSAASPTFTIPGRITSAIATFNGNDPVTLEKSGVVIDRFGQVGFNPGTAWTGTAGSATVSTLDQTLRRKSSVKVGSNDATSLFVVTDQWESFPINTASGLGSHAVDP
jgi:uncharacterized protein